MKQTLRQSASRLFTSSILRGVFLIAIIACLIVKPPSASMMASFTVNSVVDSIDAVPGNGICADAAGNCTLRAAIMEANALPGADTIIVPAGTYTLVLPATPLTYDQERLLSTGARQTGGDLDILGSDLTIIGASPATTIIQAGATTAAGIDRIFDINNPKGGPGIGIDVRLENLTLRNGNSPTEPPTNFRHGGGAIQFDGFNLATALPQGKLTIRNCVITGNQAASTGGAIRVSFGSLDIDGSEISGNTSQTAAGGGIMYDGGSQTANQFLSITNSTISGNSAPTAAFGSGGGVFASGNASFFFENNTFLNNSAGADGGAIAAVGFAAGKTKTINKNRIENNSATRGDGVFSSNSTASVSPLTLTLNVVVGNGSTSGDTGLFSTTNTGADVVANNWWGCNQGPNLDSCDRVGGAVGFGSGPWLMLSHTATPNTIPTNGSTTLQADFYTPSSGSTLTPADLVALNGRPIVFNNAVLGTISAADSQISGGKANATFTAGAIGGNGSADATVDHATATALITIAEAASVTTNPTDQTVCDGGTATFTAAANGSPAPTVQWEVSTNGGGSFSAISGATSTTLMFTATAAQNGNQYRAVFTNAGGSATSSAATLTVNTAPSVTTNPSDATVCAGATATFTAAANGQPAPSVQWQVSIGGGPFANLPGETNNTLSFTASAAQNGNRYRAVFSNSCGSANTTAATLTVNGVAITTDPADQTVCQGATASFSTTATGTGPFHYAWTLDGSPFDGDNSSISVPTGSLTIGNHSITVTTTGACGSSSQNATLTVQENTATSDPADSTVCQGATASFATTASGTGPFHYAWTLDGSPFNGDSSSINVPTSSLSVGGHTVVVTTTGACGNASQSATLTVQANTATSDPVDSTVCQGATAGFSTTASGTGPFSYAWTVDDSPAGTNSPNLSVNTTSLSVGNHTVAVTTSGACGSASQSATLTVQANTTASGPADATECKGAIASFSTAASGTGPFHYAWTLDGSPYNGDSSSITVDTSGLSIGGHSVSVTVSGTCSSVTNNATLTVNANTTTSDPADSTVCQGATAGFSTTASGTGPFTYAWTVDGSPAGTTSSINVPTGSLTVGSHTVAVTTSGACGSASQSATLTVQATTSTTDPPDQTVCQGATASFSTTASGTGPFTYAWTVDGSPAGTASSINVPTGSLTVGNHTVTVTTSGTCGSASQSATLTVNANTATTDPPDVSTCEGTTVSFTTTASGTAPFSYVWKKGAVTLVSGGRITISSSGNTSTLTISNVQAGDAGSYTVTTTGACGSASQTANLSVDSTPPTIILNGQTISLWPPNHKYETINVTDLVSGVSDSCDSGLNANSVTIASVTSDELEDSPNGGDGNTLNDIVISCNRHSVQLRAERDGNLNGRVYTILFTVTDSHGHVGTATAKVTVPPNQSGAQAVDSGPHYTVTTATCP